MGLKGSKISASLNDIHYIKLQLLTTHEMKNAIIGSKIDKIIPISANFSTELQYDWSLRIITHRDNYFKNSRKLGDLICMYGVQNNDTIVLSDNDFLKLTNRLASFNINIQ